MIRKLRFILAIPICLARTDIGLSADGVDSHLRLEILKGWAELEKLDKARPAIDAVWERQELEGPKKGSKSGISRYRRSGEAMKISSETGKVDEVVRNSRYIFVVARESDTQPWAMRFIELDLGSDKSIQLQSATYQPRYVSPASAILLGSFVRQQRTPSSLQNDPKFQITSIERMRDGLIKVNYQYELLFGEFECDPATKYLIRRGRSLEKIPSVQYDMTYEREVGPVGGDGQISVQRLLLEIRASDVLWLKDETTYSYPDVSKSGELDEERFRLTAYGLPEPEGIVWEKPRRWLPYWLAGAGALIVILSTLLIWKLRRARPQVKQP
jgi:hypothetical protein